MNLKVFIGDVAYYTLFEPKINRKCNFQTKEILMAQNTELFKAKRKEIGIKHSV